MTWVMTMQQRAKMGGATGVAKCTVNVQTDVDYKAL